ncbi:hypothetical protein PQX77_020677 [Marasmius sp. AFHP31]|nr:hypothetical protein PQX77_020677 [Marasmius sp. AFHP31]
MRHPQPHRLKINAILLATAANNYNLKAYRLAPEEFRKMYGWRRLTIEHFAGLMAALSSNLGHDPCPLAIGWSSKLAFMDYLPVQTTSLQQISAANMVL